MKKTIYSLALTIISLFIFSEANSQKLLAEFGESYNSGQFKPFDSTVYTYNSQNMAQTKIRRLYNAGNWDNFTKEHYTYTSNNELESDIYSNWTSGAWQQSYRYSYTYNGGMIDEAFESKWINGAWDTLYHEMYTYDGTKIDTVFTNKVTAGVESDYRKTAYIYTGTGKLAQTLTFEWKNNNWEEVVKWVYTYDGADRLIKQEEENMQTSGWYKVHYYTFAYDNNGVLRTHAHKTSSGNMDIGRTKYIYEGDPTNVWVNEITNTISVIAYPNPVQNKFTVSWEAEGVFNFSLIDINGKIINNINGITSNTFELDGLELPAGIYLYTLVSSDGNYAYTGRLLKQ